MTNVDATDAPPVNNDDDKNNSNARLCNGKPMYHKKMHGLFLCIVMSCTIGLICIASLVQYGNLQLPRLAVPSWHSNNAIDGNGTLGIQTKELVRHAAEDEDEWVSSFECVGWKARRTCSPANNFVWDIFHLQPVDMFEQESGPVMIDCVTENG